MCEFAIRIILYIKAPLPHYTIYERHNVYAIDSTFTNTSLCSVYFIRWRAVFAYFFLPMLLLPFVALAKGFRCANISVVDTPRFYSHRICTFTCIIDLGFLSPSLILGTANHICAMIVNSMRFIWLFVDFVISLPPLICLFRRNSTYAYECVCLCLCASELNFTEQSLISK